MLCSGQEEQIRSITAYIVHQEVNISRELQTMIMDTLDVNSTNYECDFLQL